MSGAIVVIGFGGPADEPDNPLLESFVASLTPRTRPRSIVLPNGGGSDAWSGRDTARERLAGVDVLYAGDGDLAVMVRTWRALGLDQTVADAVAKGAVYCGVGAGAAILFDAALVAVPAQALGSADARLETTPGLGLLPGGFCARADREPQRRQRLAGLVAAGLLPPSWALDDGAAVVFSAAGAVERLVASHPDACVYHVTGADNVARETRHAPQYLGGAACEDLIIRRAALGDAVGIREAHDASIRGLAAKDYSAEQIVAWTSRVFDAAEQERVVDEIRHDPMWVVEQAGRILGYAHLKTPMEWAPNVYLQALYLIPEIAGQGLARRLMQLAETEAIRRGAPAVVLHSSKTARAFYEAIGYELVGPLDQHLVAGVYLERWPMRKPMLPPAPALP